jgi:hypothetical protein
MLRVYIFNIDHTQAYLEEQMLKKSLLGLGLVLVMAFAFVIPTLASPVPDGEELKAEGIIQSVDAVAGSFTVLTEDSTEVVVYAPEGFDLALLVVGDHVEAEGILGLDGLFAATEIELQDGTEFEVDDEVEDDDAGEAEDDDDLDEDEDDDEDDEDEGDDDDEEDDDSGTSGSDSEDDGEGDDD